MKKPEKTCNGCESQLKISPLAHNSHTLTVYLRETGAACTADIVARQAVDSKHGLNKSMDAISSCLVD